MVADGFLGKPLSIDKTKSGSRRQGTQLPMAEPGLLCPFCLSPSLTSPVHRSLTIGWKTHLVNVNCTIYLNKCFHQPFSRELERWCSSSECLLLFQRTSVLFLIPTLDRSQLLVTLVLGELTPSSGLYGYPHMLHLYTFLYSILLCTS